MMTYTHHDSQPNNDGYLCKRTGEHTKHIFWEGAHSCPDGADYCPHCSDWTPASRLHDLNEKRKAEAKEKP